MADNLIEEQQLKILLVEDDKDDCELIRKELQGNFENIVTVQDGESCFAQLKSESYSVILLDYSLPRKNGLEVLREIINNGIDSPVIMITGQGDERIAADAIKLGAYDYVIKSDLKRLKISIDLTMKIYLDKLTIIKAEEDLRKSKSELATINQIANIFLTISDNKIYSEVLKIILEITKSRYGGFGYIDDIGNLVVPSLTYDVWDECKMEEKGNIFPLAQLKHTIFGKAFFEKRSLYSNELFKVPKGHVPLYRALNVPIIFHDTVIGNLFVGNKETDYTDDDMNQLNTIANSIAPILSARLIGEKHEIERKKLEEQLYQVQKMESIGRLAGGVAHDFNNILTSMMGYAELLKLQFKDSETAEGKAADIIYKGAHRASKLTQQLLGFARSGKYEQKPININEIIAETIRVSEKIFDKQIRVNCECEDNLSNVNADKNQLDQVFTNIFINAKDAMPLGGELYIKTRNIHLTKKITNTIPELESGEFVEITISDTGTGMQKEISDKIFEPFFTTKGEGKGTGLGLASAYGIIKNHEGHINCESELGKGTTFKIFLPSSNEISAKDNLESEVIHGNSTILIVDDEQDVLNVAKQLLNYLDYTVLNATDGVTAIELYKREKENIDLIILDMIMPGKNGQETFYEMKKINPEVRVILASGYSEDGKASKILNDGALGFIQKPFSIQKLSTAIADALKL